MSTTEQLDRESKDADRDQRCAVCDHNLADHDAISHRYCQATQAQALMRKCICRELG
jgi:hypothetical protein